MATATKSNGHAETRRRGKQNGQHGDPSAWRDAAEKKLSNGNGHAPAITIGEPVDVAVGKGADQVRPILLSQLEPSPTNPRKHFADAELDELAASLKQHGLLEPLVVRPDAIYITGKGKPVYEIVCGERRYRAAQRARLKEVLCRVCYFSDQEVLEIQLVENIQRADLTPLEEARAFKHLLDAGMTQEKLAQKIGRTQGHVSNRVRLLELPDDLQEVVGSGRLPATQARLLVPYLAVPAIVREMLKFAHDHARKHEGQPPSVTEWEDELDSQVDKHTVPLSGSKWQDGSYKQWSIKINDANRDALAVVPGRGGYGGQGKRSGNPELVKKLRAEMRKREQAKESKAEGNDTAKQKPKADDWKSAEQRWRREDEARHREYLADHVWALAIARRLRESRTEQHLIWRIYLTLSFDGDGMWNVDEKVFPKLKRGDVWAELERVPTSELTAVMARTIDCVLTADHAIGLELPSLQGMGGHLGIKGLPEAWAQARDEGWLKKQWAKEAKDCGHADDGKEIPLECPAWLLPQPARRAAAKQTQSPAKQGKGKK